ncbi:hypothetical protein NMY22_g11347 [Coprinellus aureogranulatus]|nr:hypothetical protein NMY22_g11347 [Coprinellus aureogranulatus]
MAPHTGFKPLNSTGTNQQKGMKRTWRERVTPDTFKETDIFWHPAMSDAPPSCYTPGLIPILKTYFTACHSRGEIRKAVLCYDQTVYIQRQAWDVTWGCGYRNFLMICAALMVQQIEPLYFPLLDEPVPPGIRNLQLWIETAWESGFDPEGKKQLKKLIGTRKWIGTADIWIAFASRGVPAELVDFESKNRGLQPLIDWTVKYFTPKAQPSPSDSPRNAFDTLKGASAVVSTDIMPFILQHSGHSRLVVGYEVDKQGKVNLLTFDCGIAVPKELRRYALSKRAVEQQSASPQSSLKRQAGGDFVNPGGVKRRRSGAPVADDDSVEIVVVSDPNLPKEEQVDDDIVITGFKSTGKVKIATTLSPGNRPSGVSPKPQLGAKDLQMFRISLKALEKHKQYQVLYFPMTAPLSESERLQRRTPVSTKVT